MKARYCYLLLLLSMAIMFVSVFADSGYGNSQPSPKPYIPTVTEPSKPLVSSSVVPNYNQPSRQPPPLVPNLVNSEEKHEIPFVPNPIVPSVGLPKNIAVQGLVYCKSGSKLIPLKGATARVTCLAVDNKGYESAPFSFSSCAADEKGYFTAKLLPEEENALILKITECKAFLENSSWNNCNVPVDVNNGLTGAPLMSSRLVNGVNLYSVGPFLYTPPPHPLSGGY